MNSEPQRVADTCRNDPEYLPECQDRSFGLEWLVVGELNHVGDGSEEGLVNMDIGIGVDGVIANVEELNDLGFWELFDDAFAAALILNQLAGNLRRAETRLNQKG